MHPRPCHRDGANAFIPFPEIQFLAYLHNAEDQLRGEAATLPFFSNGRYSNPMMLRIAGLGWAIKKASAGISTMTIRLPCCATFPV